MSKSKGNVIDPLEVIDSCSLDVLIKKLTDSNLPPQEIAKASKAKAELFPTGIPACGSDGLRFTMLAYMVQSSINLDVSRVVGYKEFCNKLWNINKLALSLFPEGFKPLPEGPAALSADMSLADKWILTRLSKLVVETNANFE